MKRQKCYHFNEKSCGKLSEHYSSLQTEEIIDVQEDHSAYILRVVLGLCVSD